MKNMFSISFRTFHDKKNKNNLFTLIIKMQIFFDCTIVTSTARVSSVFLSSCMLSTILNQEVHL